MPRPKNPVPTYRLHKPSGQAVVTLPVPGGRRDVYLGPYGSDESKAEYGRILAQLRVGTAEADGPPPADLTVNELLVRFLRHVDAYYRHPDGSPTSEPAGYRHSLRPLKTLYGHAPAGEFGPLALKAVRQRMVDDGLCRAVVNQAVGRIRRCFKWAAAEELVPADVFHRLTTVAGLRKGRSDAREAEPVLPVAAADVEATLPYLGRHLAAMARVQLLTGMRPGEVCRLTPGELDMAGPVWLYRPGRHKTAYRGKPRVVPIGPRAQEVLRPFLDGTADSPVFSPRAARVERFARMRAARRSKVPPSQEDRSKPAPARKPGARYQSTSYAHSVAKAVERANRDRARDGRPVVPHWHPNQLRHTFATAVRSGHGLEAAQVLLGHTKADVTQVYAERDLALAVRVAAQIG